MMAERGDAMTETTIIYVHDDPAHWGPETTEEDAASAQAHLEDLVADRWGGAVRCVVSRGTTGWSPEVTGPLADEVEAELDELGHQAMMRALAAREEETP